MAWSAPRTWSSGAVLTAAQLNSDVRDNMLETAPAKATTANALFVANGANAIVERQWKANTILTSETTASASFVALTTPGPSVSLTTGTTAFVWLAAGMSTSSAGGQCFMGFAISGATTLAADSATSLVAESGAASDYYQIGTWVQVLGLTAGTNVFTAQYAVSAGTATFLRRRISVFGAGS